MIFLRIHLVYLFSTLSILAFANDYRDITVAQDGTGDVLTITEAINSIPSDNFQRYVIYVKDGIYNEKVRIEKDFVTIVGQSRKHTIVQYQQAKKAWLNNKDFVGPAVINIHADDVMLENVTVCNTFEDLGPTAYVVYGTGTRCIIQHCNLWSNGANTVTLVNDKDGMYYFSDCSIQGTVDFMKTMGWCYIDACDFYQKEAIASLWHAAIDNENQKMVVKNSNFDGEEHFFLGRHHYDALIFFCDCEFSDKMADKPLYYKTYNNKPEKNRPYIYGDRHYYFNCVKQGEPYAWLKDNLSDFDTKLSVDDMDAAWTFDNLWSPETPHAIEVVDAKIDGKDVLITFNQRMTVRGSIVLQTNAGETLTFNKGKGRHTLCFSSTNIIKTKDIKKGLSLVSGQLLITTATTQEYFLLNIK